MMANNKAQQILVPMQVYIGDEAELRCTFNSNNSKIKKLLENSTDGSVYLNSSNFVEPVNLSEYDISQMKLELSGVDFFQLKINFTPWKIGTIQFPSINIEGELIDFSPVHIMSIVEQTNTTSLKEGLSPLLLPNTTYKIFAFIILITIFIIIIIRLFIKRGKILFFIKNQIIKYKNLKNKKKTIKNLENLNSKKEMNDQEFAQNFQQIMRKYLQIHYNYPFMNCVTSKLENAFSIISKDLFSEEKKENFSSLVRFFVRTDFIRFSGKGKFLPEERQKIIDSTKQIIQFLEQPDD